MLNWESITMMNTDSGFTKEILDTSLDMKSTQSSTSEVFKESKSTRSIGSICMVQTKSGYKASGEPLTILQQHRRPPHAKETTSTMTNTSCYSDEDEDDYEDEDDDNKSKNRNKTMKHGSHHPLKVEARIDISTYDGTVDAEKFDS
ncbi:hypothetical protein Tco_1032858 [Tanacetum coccineum]|uniref:Uncharacterized protein n=1 Tax=Tanacetum coccineum TaxID=301880 RepID=A0ABQ5GF35_9ASTR